MERKIQVEFVANRNDRRFRSYKSEKVANKKSTAFLKSLIYSSTKSTKTIGEQNMFP